MSSILKALKKLEEEKSLLQTENKINVSREILKQPAESRISVKWLWLPGIAAFGVIFMLTFALMRKSSPKEEVKSPGLPVISQPTPAPTPTLTGPDSTPLTDNENRVVSTTPSAAKRLNLMPPQQLLNPTRESSIKREPLELPNTPIPTMDPPKAEPAGKSNPPRTALKPESTLTLSGIAWNKDSADRLAIINGQPTATGATLNGAVVEEILPDRVRLSHNGRTIELFIGRSAGTD